MKEMVSLAETPSATEPEAWLADVTVYPAGEKRSLVHANSSGATCLVHSAYAELLAQCREFQTLDEHLAAFCHRKQPGGTPMSAEVVQGLRTKLQQLAQEGYLISENQMRSLFEEANAPALPTRITTMGFPTCDRVETLRTSLSSYLEHCQRFGRSPEFVVMDDSPSPSTRAAYREMLRGLKRHYGMSITYAGLEEKTAYVRRLSERGQIPEEVVSWACLGDRTYNASTHGANRNALLLHTIGECLFSSDDDTICRVAASPGFQEGLILNSRVDLLRYWYYPDREQALAAVPPTEQDFFALHEQWLGHNPKEAGASYSRAGQISFEQIEPGFLRRFASRSGRVALALHGVVGDASYGTTDFLFFHPDESLKQLMISEEAYRSAQTNREMAQVVNQLILTANPHHMVNIGGLDNRELLPPFTHVGKTEDYAFGLMLSSCFPDAYAVYLPWVLLHAPPEARAYAKPLFAEGDYITREIPFYAWLPRCIGLFHLAQASTPAEHLLYLGQFLESIGRLPPSAFEEFALHLLCQSDGANLSWLEKRLQKDEGFLASYKQDVVAYCAQARQCMLLPAKQRLRGGAELAQRALVQFAQILYWWPKMLETARSLRTDGYRIAQPL